MKKIISITTLVTLLSIPTFAGDDGPGVGSIEILNVSNPRSEVMPDLRQNPMHQNDNVSTNAIHSELVSAYLDLPDTSGDENTTLTDEEKRIKELGKHLHDSMIKAGYKPVKNIEEANLVFHYEVQSCDYFGDGGDCFYTSNSSCQSDYKTVARISTLDGRKSDMWNAKEGQSSFMAVNFSNYNDKISGICKYQYESMKSAFSKINK